VQLFCSDYSEYVNSGYGYNETRDKLAGEYVSELTEHDLKWLSRDLRVRIRQLPDQRNLVLEFTIKEGKTFRKILTNESGKPVR